MYIDPFAHTCPDACVSLVWISEHLYVVLNLSDGCEGVKSVSLVLVSKTIMVCKILCSKSHSISHLNALCSREITKSANLTDVNLLTSKCSFNSLYLNCKSNWFKNVYDYDITSQHIWDAYTCRTIQCSVQLTVWIMQICRAHPLEREMVMWPFLVQETLAYIVNGL